MKVNEVGFLRKLRWFFCFFCCFMRGLDMDNGHDNKEGGKGIFLKIYIYIMDIY